MVNLANSTPPPFDPQSPDSWATWFVGTPLTILLILLLGSIAMMVLRKIIRSITNHLAHGTWMNNRGMRKLGETEIGSALFAANPLANARREQRARTIGSVLRSTATLAIGSIMLLMLLDELGVNIMPLMASAGVVGVALGFGAQSLVKDFLSGVFMLLEDQYGVGDIVTFGDVGGTVEAVGLRVTKIRDVTGTLWYLRNGEILRVGNRTQGWARVIVEVKLRVDTDVAAARALLMEAAQTLKQDADLASYLQEEPEVIGIETLSAESVLLKAQVKTDPTMQWAVARALREAIREKLEAADVPLAVQQQTLIITEPAPPAPSGPGSTASSEPQDNTPTRGGSGTRSALPDE